MIVVAAIWCVCVGAIAVVVAAHAAVVATVVVACGVEGARLIYPGIVSACCCKAYTAESRAVEAADAAIGNHARGRCAVGLLSGVGEDAALAVAGVVGVLVAGFGVCFHAVGG